MTYMCSHFSKSEDKCSFAIKFDQFNTVKNILKAYTSNRECGKSGLKKDCQSCYFARAASQKGFSWSQICKYKFTRKMFEILQTEEQLNSLPKDSTGIFKRNNFNHYFVRPSV